ncbi:MAG TPA: DinB family protein [Ktedonobacteraceae bacterium]|nr:DinB family protein [Ktedonobacteraceae bacterium]
MNQEKRETREEEVARVRSYLANQAMKRTSEQLVEALREAHERFLAATGAISDDAFRIIPKEGEWSAADVLAHVCAIAAFDERSIRGVIERGAQPKDVEDALEKAPSDATREQLLADIERYREQLIAVVLKADPQAHLDIVWGHNEFGKMNWREWLLFARVHTLDHTRQMQAIAAVLSSMSGS